MLRKVTLFAALGFFLLMAACSKNTSKPDSNGSSSLVGNYTFAYMTTNVNVTESGSYLGQAIKVVGTTGYTTTQNMGTVTFTKDSLIGNGIGYSYDAPTTVIYYANNIPIDTTVDQASETVPPTSSRSTYQIIGADSIYFPGGALGLDGATAGAPVPVAPPTGGHFVVKGDSLFITAKINQSFPDSYNGIPVTATANVTATIAMKKQ
ncbi:MAG: hypothetical protein JST68_03885 [Bacteroidetes bacterium]|nr:hypothetical protein [Bacteroidota bacterium]